MTTLPVTGVLIFAAATITRVGHTKGTQRSRSGRMCVSGAILTASGYEGRWVQGRAVDGWPPVAEQARALLLSHLRVPSLAEWNDAPETTANKVVTALYETADVLLAGA